MLLNTYGAAFQVYAQGYFDGRSEGVESESSYALSDDLRQYYNAGYECGVGDYCRELDCEGSRLD